MVLVAGLVLSWGPLSSYRDAHAKLADKAAQVDLMKQTNRALREQVNSLEETRTLEALARKDLAYALPGEQVCIVQGLPESTSTPAPQPAPDRGPLEKLLSAVRGLF
jgi:hypothetical protein